MEMLKIKDVIKITGLSRVSLWRLEQSGDFPPRRVLSPNRVGWLLNEIEEWTTSRPTVSDLKLKNGGQNDN